MLLSQGKGALFTLKIYMLTFIFVYKLFEYLSEALEYEMPMQNRMSLCEKNTSRKGKSVLSILHYSTRIRPRIFCLLKDRFSDNSP